MNESEPERQPEAFDADHVLLIATSGASVDDEYHVI